MKVKNIRASLLEIAKRVIRLTNADKNKIYFNGENNLYAEEVDAVINASPTALSATRLMATYICGSGFTLDGNDLKEEDLPILNESKHYTLADINEMASRSLSRQGGVWIHRSVYFNSESKKLETKDIDVIDYVLCRKEAEDSDENKGKIYVKDWGGKNKKMNEYYYPFTNDQAVIYAQIEADAKERGVSEESDIYTQLKHYRGQVLYINTTPEYQYAMPPIHAVFNECDSEAKIIDYTNIQARTGFYGKTIVVTKGLDPEDIDQTDKDFQKFMGADGSSSLYKLDISETDDITQVIHVQQLKPQYDDKLFTLTEARIRKNILASCNNIPEPLVYAGEGALFGVSAEAYKEMKDFYSEQTALYREKLAGGYKLLGFNITIKPIG